MVKCGSVNLRLMATITIAPPEEGASRPAPPAHPQTSPWIYRPWIDLTVGCGAWSAPLLLAGFYAANSHARGWSVAFYFLALLSNYPHFMATVYRAYHKRDEFEKYRTYTLHVALLLALSGVVAHVWYGVLPWIFTLYICWSPWHYTGQNFGLLMMFARRAGIAPTEMERAALRLSFIASYILLLLSFHTGSSPDPLILSLGLPAKLTLPARISLALFFLGVSGWALASLARRSNLRALLPVYTLTATQFLWFLLPAIIELASGREIPQTRYSSGLLAVLHSTQYLWITSYYQRKEARAAGSAQWSFWGYLVTLIAGGIALFIPGPWIVSRIFHTDFAASFLTFTALVNIHHFILDGKIWKLRDSRVASVLFDGQQKIGERPVKEQTSVARAAHWLTGSTAGARAVRVATVILLFAWAAVDQVHYWWSSNAGSLQALERAAKLNPNDSSVLARLAVAQETAGQRDAALGTMKRAATINPQSSAIQESYGRLLVETGRSAEAYAQFRKMVLQWPRNANAWIDYGMLAHRLGHDEEAVDSWQKAVDADPTESNAQLYLAQALDQEGQLQAAARHYRAYLELLAQQHERNPKAGPELLAALIRVADADVAANQINDASKGYRAAIAFAHKAGEKTLESLALAHLADLQEKLSDLSGAAQSYQQALQLDAALSDPHSPVSDWFNYAQFLRKRGEPERYVLACLLKAEAASQAKGVSADEVSAVKQALEESEQRIGKAAASVRQQSDAIAAEALKLDISHAASNVVAKQ
jgi:tetratricopeptide (TPR) repeat protein